MMTSPDPVLESVRARSGHSRRAPSSPSSPPGHGRTADQKNIAFYVKVDAAEILSPPFRRYADHANYLQHRILVGRMLWGTDDATGQYTLLKSAYLRRVINSHILKPLTDEMRRIGLIQRDNHYIEGEKSYGYRIGDDHVESPTIRLACRSAKLSHRIYALRREDYREYRSVHKHLLHWLGHLEIDGASAQRIIDNMTFTEAALPTEQMRDLNHLSIQAISDREWEFKVCHYGRVHTNVTRLLKPLRELLTIDGAPLVSLDLANSQPLFLLVAILKQRPDETRRSVNSDVSAISAGLPIPSHITSHISTRSNIPPTDINTRSNYPPPYTMFNSMQHADSQMDEANDRLSADLGYFKELCESGRLYGHLMHRMGWTSGKAAFKSQELFRCLYGTNRPWDVHGEYNPSRLQPVLEADFPTVWSFITDWKRRHGYRDLACQMQRAESKLMIEGVCGRLMREHPDCPLVTIHDSIMTTAPWVEVVRNAILEEFAKIGIRPTLHVE